MKASRNTLLISGLAAAGLVAVWYFLLRKSSTAATDQLGSALGASTTTTTPGAAAALSGTPGATDLAGTVKGLFNDLVATLKPAATTGTTTTTTPSAAEKLWIKVKKEAGNLWTNVTTGQQQTLEKGHNPNLAATLTAGDKLALTSTANESLASVMAANTAATSAAAAALAPAPLWVKTSRNTNATGNADVWTNTWTNTKTGVVQDTIRGRNPNDPTTLTATDKARLLTAENEKPTSTAKDSGW